MRRLFTAVTLFALTLTVSGAAKGASPTPIPGGANQVKGVTGNVGDTLWNGIVRFTVTDLREARPEDHPETMLPSATQKVMVFNALLRNGTSKEFAELLSYTLADKDDVSFLIPSYTIKPAPLSVQQGAAARIGGMFLVDKTYVPVKLLVQCETCGKPSRFTAFRIAVPAAPSPAST